MSLRSVRNPGLQETSPVEADLGTIRVCGQKQPLRLDGNTLPLVPFRGEGVRDIGGFRGSFSSS